MTTTETRTDRRTRHTSGTRHRRAALWFLLPFAVPFVAFYVLPVVYAFAQSLQRISRGGGSYGKATSVWAGLFQYDRALHDPDFVASLVRVAWFSLIQIPVMLLVALVLALLLDTQTARLRRFHRLAIFVPYAIPGVIAALMWAYLYDPRLSPLTQAMSTIGLDPDFLSPSHILWSIANVVTWTYAGYNMVVMYAALQAIPTELYEAAAVDGAGELRIALQIKVPLIKPALVLTAVFSIIGTLQLFTEPQVLRTITTSITSTYTPNMAAFNAASANDYSYAAALSLILAAVSFVFSFGLLRRTTRGEQA